MLIEQVELLILLKIDSILWLKTARYRRFVVMLCYRPIQRLSDDRSINLNLSDHVRFSREKKTLAVCTNMKNQACFICDHIEYKL